MLNQKRKSVLTQIWRRHNEFLLVTQTTQTSTSSRSQHPNLTTGGWNKSWMNAKVNRKSVLSQIWRRYSEFLPVTQMIQMSTSKVVSENSTKDGRSAYLCFVHSLPFNSNVHLLPLPLPVDHRIFSLFGPTRAWSLENLSVSDCACYKRILTIPLLSLQHLPSLHLDIQIPHWNTDVTRYCLNSLIVQQEKSIVANECQDTRPGGRWEINERQGAKGVAWEDRPNLVAGRVLIRERGTPRNTWWRWTTMTSVIIRIWKNPSKNGCNNLPSRMQGAFGGTEC